MQKSSRVLIQYSVGLAVLLILLKWLETRFLFGNYSVEMLIGIVAIMFTLLGIWLTRNLIKPQIKTLIVEKEVIVKQNAGFIFSQEAVLDLKLTDRELEVLKEISKGLSNQEIADKLNLSLATIKTHAYKLFEKLDVKRRTQAIEKAKSLNIIP
ncbi:MAG: winged helix-turn-helix transcriptional regulator [Bacteroidia bacterium]|nr:winged helix-turn-helix transcriptional regulator [Bacteroidia bacterium]